MVNRPIRDAQELVTENFPQGPLGVIGGGNAIGAVGVAAVQVGALVVPGSELDPGFTVVSSSTERLDDGVTKGTFVINAYSRDVARFVAKKRTAPSNIDLLIRDVEVDSVEEVSKRRTASTFRVETTLDEQDVKDKITGGEDG